MMNNSLHSKFEISGLSPSYAVAQPNLTGLVGNPKDRFSPDKAQTINAPLHNKTPTSLVITQSCHSSLCTQCVSIDLIFYVLTVKTYQIGQIPRLIWVPVCTGSARLIGY